MKIVLSGASGYIGRNLALQLKISGHIVVTIDRAAIYNIELLTKNITDTDVVIHLSGAPILCKWTESNKKEILKSRTDSTRNIVKVINDLPSEKSPHTFISASAIGIYSPNKFHTETSTSFTSDFVGEVVKQWEHSSDELITKVRKVIFRIAPVLGKEAQMIRQLMPIFKLGLGGKIGSGKQPFPFVHINDVVKSVMWAINNSELDGVYNLVAPQCITNEQFTKALSKTIHRPAFFTVPEFALRLFYGEAASVIFQTPDVYPERLLNSGYKFIYPDIQATLAEITA